MCLIVVKPKDVKNTFTYEMFKDAAKANSDSLGLLFLKNGKMKVKKYLYPLKHLKSIYNKIKDKSQYAIHFRFATHGVLDLSNAHPFEIVPGLWMMHNGILNEFGKTNPNWSDTRDFAINYMRPIIMEKGIEILMDKDFQKNLAKKIGYGNKLVFIDKDFNTVIINECEGVWNNGLWYSNSRTLHKSFDYNYYYSNYNPSKKINYNDYYHSLDYFNDYDFPYDLPYGYDPYDMPDNCDKNGIPYYDDEYDKINLF